MQNKVTIRIFLRAYYSRAEFSGWCRPSMCCSLDSKCPRLTVTYPGMESFKGRNQIMYEYLLARASVRLFARRNFTTTPTVSNLNILLLSGDRMDVLCIIRIAP